MTPMVDVVMVILIFFMASASLLGPELLLRAAVAGEPAAAGARADAEPLIEAEPPTFVVQLRITAGEVTVDGFGMRGGDLEALDAAAASVAEALGRPAAADTRVVITAEDAAPYAAVVRAAEALRAAGFESVGIR